MDIAYDHITEETYSSDRAPTPTPQKAGAQSSAKPNLNTEFQETFRAFSNSPWGAKLGGLWGNVRKQSEQYYEGARREVEGAGEEALKGFSDLKESIVKQTQKLSLDSEKTDSGTSRSDGDDTPTTGTDSQGTRSSKRRTESEVIRENESLISRFRSEAAKRLKDIEKAEDAADEALLRFGTNIRNFLRDAVAIAPPVEDNETNNTGSVLFESKDSTGKRVIHTTRFDAQLHVIHSTFDSFTKDPISGEWPKFKDDFNTEQKTEHISRDLEKYPELRRAMEQLVPEKVDYKDFWCRYYFLRLVIETEEQKRRELLKASTANNTEDEEITWDADSDEEDDQQQPTPHKITLTSDPDTSSTTTLLPQDPSHPQQPALASSKPGLIEGRRSHDQHSQPDSDASYDLVSRSGATSRTPGSPKEEKERKGVGVGAGTETGKTNDEESDEEDWE